MYNTVYPSTIMVKHFTLEFEKGGKFTAELLESSAPRTCKAFWDTLPITVRIEHAVYSGEAFFAVTPQLKIDYVENPKRLGFVPGDVAFNPLVLYGNTPEIVLVYGPFLPSDSTGPLSLNYFAKITKGNLDQLRAAGSRNRQEGFENITLSRVTTA